MFSVLMAVYAGTKPGELSDALESLGRQTYLPTEIVLVKDGPIHRGVENVLETFRDRLPLQVWALEENSGLARALNHGLQYCTQPWVARFDADDVCMKNRFDQQRRLILEGAYDVIGSAVEEFETDSQVPHAIRKVPCRERHIKRFCLWRNPFNHMSVCFRRSLVVAVGGYPDIPFMQDYGLWVKLVATGARMRNTKVPTVRVRTGNGMHSRRGGWNYVYSEVLLQRLMVKLGLKPRWRALLDGLARSAVFVAPLRIRQSVYQRFLRKTFL